MNRLVVLFITILLTTITSFSQTISNDSVKISSEQLKQINLIFAEHSKLLSENKILSEQIVLYQKLNETNNSIIMNKDSIINAYSVQYEQDKLLINNLQKSVKSNKKALNIWRGIGIGTSAISLSLIGILLLR